MQASFKSNPSHAVGVVQIQNCWGSLVAVVYTPTAHCVTQMSCGGVLWKCKPIHPKRKTDTSSMDKRRKEGVRGGEGRKWLLWCVCCVVPLFADSLPMHFFQLDWRCSWRKKINQSHSMIYFWVCGCHDFITRMESESRRQSKPLVLWRM